MAWELQLDDGGVIQFDHEPSDQEINFVMAQISKPKSIKEDVSDAGKAIKQAFTPAGALDVARKGLSYPLGLPANPLNLGEAIGSFRPSDIYFELMPQMERGGAAVKEAAGNVLGAMPDNSLVGGATKFGVGLLPFEPSSFAGYIGTPALAALRAGAGKSGILPEYARSQVEAVVPSSPLEIKAAEKSSLFGGGRKTAAQKIIDRPELGNTRREIIENAQSGIERTQMEIQAAIDSADNIIISKDQFASVFQEALDDLKGVPGRSKQIKAIQKARSEFFRDKDIPEKQSLSKWDVTRQKLNKDVGSKGYLTDKTSVQIGLDKGFANKIRDLLADRLPGIRRLRREQGDMLQIRDAIIESAPKEARQHSILGPLYERGTFKSARFLSMPRTAFGQKGTAASRIPLIAGGMMPDEIE